MNEQILAVYDRDASWLERLSSYWRRRKKLAFTLCCFTDEGELDQFLAVQKADILLIGEDTWTEERAARAGLTFRLSRERDSCTDGNTLYRYRSAADLLGQILAAYEELRIRREPSADSSSEVFGIYSPVRRCYKTTLALTMALLLARRDSTLFLSFEDCAGYRLPGIPETARGLSDILYYRRVDPGGEQAMPASAVSSSEGLAVLPPVSCPGDIRTADPEEAADLVRDFVRRMSFRYLVVDAGDALADPVPLLSLCRRIYMPVREDGISEQRLRLTEETFRRRGGEALAGRIRRLSLPFFSELNGRAPDPGSLADSSLASYVRTLLEQEDR